jgi:hypothetical protein
MTRAEGMKKKIKKKNKQTNKQTKTNNTRQKEGEVKKF